MQRGGTDCHSRFTRRATREHGAPPGICARLWRSHATGSPYQAPPSSRVARNVSHGGKQSLFFPHVQCVNEGLPTLQLIGRAAAFAGVERLRRRIEVCPIAREAILHRRGPVTAPRHMGVSERDVVIMRDGAGMHDIVGLRPGRGGVGRRRRIAAPRVPAIGVSRAGGGGKDGIGLQCDRVDLWGDDPEEGIVFPIEAPLWKTMRCAPALAEVASTECAGAVRPAARRCPRVGPGPGGVVRPVVSPGSGAGGRPLR